MTNSRGPSRRKLFFLDGVGCLSFLWIHPPFMSEKLQHLTSSRTNIGVLSFPSKVLLFLLKLLNSLTQTDTGARLTPIIFWP